MIGKNLQDNLDIKVNSKKMEKLKDDFPEFFTKEGDFKLDSFKDFLKEEEVELTKEAYELDFLGKSYAKYESSLNTETYISPDVEHNEKPENKDSENIYIVGDNIDALRHLLGSYSGKIKCIYIDPPYNTGSDGFVYTDNFKFTNEDLAEKIGITEEEADRILNLEGKSSHAAWLTFMYPRLLLARDLLEDDGVAMVSLDENEYAQFKLVADEIFGEGNVESFIWNKEAEGSSGTLKQVKRFRRIHEYIFVLYKDKDLTIFNKIREALVGREGELQTANLAVNLNNENIDHPNYFTIVNSHGDKFTRQWKWSKEEIDELDRQNLIYWGSDGRKQPRLIIPTDDRRKVFMLSILKYGGINIENTDNTIYEYGGTTVGNKEIEDLFGAKDLFENPKPVILIKKLLETSTNQESLILDFFSGSATTADAVMQLNAEDGGSRKYMLVQLPETIPTNKPAYKAGYRTVDEIGRDRIEKAAAKIKDETKADIDYGYKLFYLEKPSEKTLLDLEEFKPEIKLVSDDMISVFDNKHASGKENILATWLNEDGYGLTKETKDYKLENYTAQLIEKTLYIIDEGLESDDVMRLIKQIEDDSLDITRLVIYSYSVKFSVLNELRKNIKVLKNNKNVTLIERF